MNIKYFKSVRFQGDWELNFIGEIWNLRIGRSQITLWKKDNIIWSWFSKRVV